MTNYIQAVIGQEIVLLNSDEVERYYHYVEVCSASALRASTRQIANKCTGNRWMELEASILIHIPSFSRSQIENIGIVIRDYLENGRGYCKHCDCQHIESHKEVSIAKSK